MKAPIALLLCLLLPAVVFSKALVDTNGDGKISFAEIRKQNGGDNPKLNMFLKLCKENDKDNDEALDYTEWQNCRKEHGVDTPMLFEWYQSDYRYEKEQRKLDGNWYKIFIGTETVGFLGLLFTLYQSYAAARRSVEALAKQKEQHDESIEVSKEHHNDGKVHADKNHNDGKVHAGRLHIDGKVHADILHDKSIEVSKEQHDEALKEQKKQHDEALAQEREMAAKVVLFELDKCIMDKAIGGKHLKHLVPMFDLMKIFFPEFESNFVEKMNCAEKLRVAREHMVNDLRSNAEEMDDAELAVEL